VINIAFANEFVGTIIITDLLGREIFQTTSNTNLVQIDLTDLPAKGIYFTKIMSSDGRLIAVEKFIYQ
jgi:hypothetical protein